MIIDNLPAIAGAVLLACFGGYIAYRNNKKNRASNSAKEFRNVLFKSLIGLYPVTRYWPESEYPRFRQSILIIESAAAEFERYVFRKNSFRKALEEYTDFCKSIQYHHQLAWEMYSKTREQFGDKSSEPRKEFERIVNNLLSFADFK